MRVKFLKSVEPMQVVEVSLVSKIELNWDEPKDQFKCFAIDYWNWEISFYGEDAEETATFPCADYQLVSVQLSDIK